MRPTEDIEKVKVALAKVITGFVQSIPTGKDKFTLRIESDDRSSLERFKMILQRDRIRAAARAVLLRSVQSDTIEFYLNKQVAHAGHVSFSQAEGESSLGPIQVKVKSSDIPSLIEWLTSGKGTDGQ